MLEVDEAMPRVLGWEAADLVGKTSLEFIHPDDQALAVEHWMQMLGRTGASRPLRVRHRHRDGSWLWIEIVNHNYLDDPEVGSVLADMTVVDPEGEDGAATGVADGLGAAMAGPESRPMQLHEALRARELLLHRLSDALPVGVLHVDVSGRILYTNHRLHAITGRERAPSFTDQLAGVMPSDWERAVDAFNSALHGGLDNDIELRLDCSGEGASKEIRQCTLSVRTLASDDGEIIGAVACVTDVTDSVQMREELRRRATFDELTSCHNRGSTMDTLEKMVASTDPGRPAVIFVDLDNFKGINDHLGHATGDEVLSVVARRLRRSVREGDVVGRIGGDEFLVLCPAVHTPVQALRAAKRVSTGLHSPIRLDDVELSCRASIGVAWSADPDLDADALVGQADAAMYEAKRSASASPVMFRASGG